MDVILFPLRAIGDREQARLKLGLGIGAAPVTRPCLFHGCGAPTNIIVIVSRRGLALCGSHLNGPDWTSDRNFK